MRLKDYYSRVIRDGRAGRPSYHEARHDYRRQMSRHTDALRTR